MTSSTSSPAIAKAKLLTSALNHAAELKLSTTAVAVLAHLIADSWPQDDGWTAHTPQTTLATKLNCSTETIRRAVADLSTIIDHRPGQGSRRSRYVFRWVPTPARGRPLTDEGGSPHPRGEGPHTHEGTFQVLPDLEHQQQQQREPSSAPSTDAPAAAGAQPLSPALSQDIIDERVRFLRRRPDWLPELKPWITVDVVEELARRPDITQQLVTKVLRQARDSRNTLTNPAGWIVAQLRRSTSTNP